MAWKHISLKRSSIVLTDTQEKFLDTLDDLLDFDIVITSGTRTARQQASAMWNKIQKGENLLSLYSSGNHDIIQEIIEAGSKSRIEDIIDAAIEKGRYISDHLGGNAVDVRTNGLTSAEIDEVANLARGLGASTLLESDHLHIEDLRGWSLSDIVDTALPVAQSAAMLWFTYLGLSAGVVGFLYLLNKRKNR